jgi:Xaa-Pro aminopeptidase
VAGEPVVLDIGGPLGGYGSDITRTIWVGGGDPGKGPDEEFLRIHELVRDAQRGRRRAGAARLDGTRGVIDRRLRRPVQSLHGIRRPMIYPSPATPR